MCLQIYSEKSSARLDYALDLLLGTVIGVEYNLKNDISQIDTSLPLINYSDTWIDNAVQIVPHSILFDKAIVAYDIEVEEYHFFKTSDQAIAYDILASSFYMATRYEEYLESNLDKHGRYRAENSLAYRNGFLEKAVVHRWSEELKKQLKINFPDLEFKERTYSYLSTIDIDSAYAFRAKGFKRLFGGLFKAFLRKDFEDFKARLSFILLGKKDPFDVYDDLEFLHEKYNTEVKYFFLVGKNGTYDKNISLSKKTYQLLIRRLSAHADIGLHPSYGSNLSLDILKAEKEKFSDVSAKSAISSRQHFLKLTWPETYQNLIKADVKTDYTMGFASQVGFRSGLCVPYKFFDLSLNKGQELTIVPFQIMDGTLNQYLALDTEEAWQKVQMIHEEVKLHDGLLVTLWHNESLSEMRNWKGWKSFYEDMLKQF